MTTFVSEELYSKICNTLNSKSAQFYQQFINEYEYDTDALNYDWEDNVYGNLYDFITKNINDELFYFIYNFIHQKISDSLQSESLQSETSDESDESESETSESSESDESDNYLNDDDRKISLPGIVCTLFGFLSLMFC